jgi:CheY-like chemotaxis protein
MILERAGYKVISTNSPEAAVLIFTGSPVDAVVFGDSIPADQRLELALNFKSLNSSVPIIALSNSSGSQLASGIVDEQLESLGDPHLLVEAVNRVLALGSKTDGGEPSKATLQKNHEVPTRLN